MSVWAASACCKSTRSESGRANIHAACCMVSLPASSSGLRVYLSSLPSFTRCVKLLPVSRFRTPRLTKEHSALTSCVEWYLPTQLSSRFDLHVHGPTVSNRHSLSLSLAFLPTRVIFADGRACVIYLGCLVNLLISALFTVPTRQTSNFRGVFRVGRQFHNIPGVLSMPCLRSFPGKYTSPPAI